MDLNITWPQMRNFIQAKNITLSVFITPAIERWEVNRYLIVASADGINCSLSMDESTNDDFVDFRDSYLPSANKF